MLAERLGLERRDLNVALPLAVFSDVVVVLPGSGATAGAITGSAEYAVVSDSAGHVHVFAADHAAVELDGLSNGANGVGVGQILAA